MYRSFPASKDCYITDRVIKKQRVHHANVGDAGTLDLFKLYGVSKSGSNPNIELSRILVKFDCEDLRNQYESGKLDITSNFNVSLNLFDVYGGQPTPSNFTVLVCPLSRAFDEGIGQDVVYYRDTDAANFITSSVVNGTPVLWHLSGANAKGGLGDPAIDVILSGNLGKGIENLFVTQSFKAGDENLQVDVTKIVSSTITRQLENHGFRISFIESQENDDRTRFVKRFGSRLATDPFLRPQLVSRYDDAMISNESNFTFDSYGTLYLHNYVRGNLTNLVSGSDFSNVTGSDCLLLKLVTPIAGPSGSVNYEMFVTGSQAKVGNTFLTGVYTATFRLSSVNENLRPKLLISGAVKFDQIWTSFDNRVAYHSGSLTVNPQLAHTGPLAPQNYSINATNVVEQYRSNENARIKVFVFDNATPHIKASKVPLITPSVVIERAYYSVRDCITDTVVIPFDTTYNSTRLSGDATTMYFDLWMNSLPAGRTYTIDILVVEGGTQQIYRNVSPAFRVLS